jgi:hypothetical protein
VLAVPVPEHQVDAAVGAPAIRVFVPEPYLIDLRRPLRVGRQKPFDEMLELPAPFDGIGIEALIEVGKQTCHLVSAQIDGAPTPLANGCADYWTSICSQSAITPA